MARISSQHAQLVGARPAELGRVCRLCTQVSLRGCFRSVSLTLFSFLPCSCLIFLYLLECLTKNRTFIIPNVIAPRALPQCVLTNILIFVPHRFVTQIPFLYCRSECRELGSVPGRMEWFISLLTVESTSTLHGYLLLIAAQSVENMVLFLG